MLSDAFIDRLRAAYREGIEGFAGHGESMWVSIDELRQNLHTAILEADTPTLRDLLGSPLKTKLYFGVDEIYHHDTPLGPEYAAHAAAMSSEALERAAVILGAWRCPNPEGGENYPHGAAPRLEPEEALPLLDRIAGTQVEFPNPFPGEAGLQTSRGIASVRSVGAVYQALRVRHFCNDSLERAALEIGGGVGRTAYYSVCFGVRDYTIVDLPLTLAGQAVFVALTLGEDRVHFGGGGAGSPGVTLLTPQQFHDCQRSWRVALNVDSLPEIDHRNAALYIERLRRDQTILLSINHEANRSAVADIAGTEFRRMRAPYALRPGYLEEVYDFRSGAS